LQKVGRQTDADYRRDAQKYLTPSQIDSLIKAVYGSPLAQSAR
jgi:hypothetical protein